MNKAFGTIILGGFAVFGVFMLVAAVAEYSNTKQFLSIAESAKGRVIEFEKDHISDQGGGTTYAPVIHFITTKGEAIEFRTSWSTSRRPQIGETIAVLYDPTNPQTVETDNFMGLWFGSLLVGGMGLIFSVIGFGSLLTFVARWRREA